jgi:hypothetical protein
VNPISVLKLVSFKHILKGILLGLSRPFFILPTLKATKDCMKISTDHYGKLHYKNGQANAFRHALWNSLMAQRCFYWKKNEEVVLDWTKKVTDLHEQAFPNKPLAKAMDLHNNAVGRSIFEQNIGKSEEEIIAILKEMTSQSIIIEENTDISQLKNQLVHIIES